MRKCNTLSCCELEQKVIEYITNNPRCSIEQIANDIGYHKVAIHRILEGRKGSRSLIGLVNTNVIAAVPGINCKGNLCWLYEVI